MTLLALRLRQAALCSLCVLLTACASPTGPSLVPQLTAEDTEIGDVPLGDAVTATDAGGDGQADDATLQDAAEPDASEDSDAALPSDGQDAPDAADAPDVPLCDPAACDDKNPCTIDACEPSSGKCVSSAKPGCGAILAACSIQADCKTGVCDPTSLSCVACLKAADCGPGALCLAQQCKPAPACQSDAQCKAQKQVCSKTDAVCVDCIDKNDCAANQACVAQVCVPVPTACQSSKDCPHVCDKTKGVCVTCLGDSDCPASEFCNAQQLCQADVCAGPTCSQGGTQACKANGSGYEPPKVCDDANPCTDNVCQAPLGCVFPPNTAPCSDGSACTDKDVCFGGKCSGSPIAKCDDGNPCTDDTCNPQTGCVFAGNTAPCDDGNGCTTTDKCAGGKCTGSGGKICNDNNPCTDDGCANNVCSFTANAGPCDDGKPCSVGEVCKTGACTAGAAKVCNDNNECTTDACDAATGSCVFTSKAGCLPVNALPCDKAADCPSGTCDLALHACVPCVTSANCPSGQICQEHVCKPAPACTSDVQCKATKQVCNVAGKVCVDCSSKADCAADQQCVENTCVAAPACTSSKQCPKVCHVGKGFCVECVSSLDCPGGQFCNQNQQCEAPVCKDKACLQGSLFLCKPDGAGYGQGVACEDGNVCTDNGCDPAKGCTTAPNSAPCTSAEACSSQCQGGTCVAKGSYLFDKTYGDNDEEEIEGIAALPDGGFALVGRSITPSTGSDEALVLRTDAAGVLLWQEGLGGTGFDIFFEAAPAIGGGFVSAGYTSYKGKGGSDAWLVRWNLDGSMAWEQTYGTAAADRAYSVTGLSDGYLLTGRSNAKSESYSDLYVVRTDAAGKELWSQFHGGTGSDSGNAAVALPDGGFAVTGWTYKSSYDLWLVRLDKNGQKLWDKTYGGSLEDAGQDIALHPDGSLVLAGTRDRAGNGGEYPWVLQVDAVGTELWSKKTLGGAYDEFYGVTVLPDGGVGVVGRDSTSGDVEDQAWFVRLDKAGNVLTDKKYGGNDDEYGAAIAYVGGGFAIAGGNESKSGGVANAWLLRTDAWGHSSCAEAGTCVPGPVSCDDGNACTLDACVGDKGGCVHTPILGCCDGANCCQPMLEKDFEDGKLEPLTTTGSSSTVKWQVTSKGKAKSGLSSLYYGNPAVWNYSTGTTTATANSGSVKLPVFVVPATGKTVLSFAAYQDIETDLKYDLLTVTAITSAGSSVLWTKTSATVLKVWQAVLLDLTAFAGKSVVLEFSFTTVDGTNNHGEGVYLDDIKVLKNCP